MKRDGNLCLLPAVFGYHPSLRYGGSGKASADQWVGGPAMNRGMGDAPRCFLAVAAFLAAAAWSVSACAAEVPRMEPETLRSFLGRADVAVIDVRPDAGDAGIPGAVVEDPRNVSAWAGKYPKGKNLVLYCS